MYNTFFWLRLRTEFIILHIFLFLLRTSLFLFDFFFSWIIIIMVLFSHLTKINPTWYCQFRLISWIINICIHTFTTLAHCCYTPTSTTVVIFKCFHIVYLRIYNSIMLILYSIIYICTPVTILTLFFSFFNFAIFLKPFEYSFHFTPQTLDRIIFRLPRG